MNDIEPIKFMLANQTMDQTCLTLFLEHHRGSFFSVRLIAQPGLCKLAKTIKEQASRRLQVGCQVGLEMSSASRASEASAYSSNVTTCDGITVYILKRANTFCTSVWCLNTLQMCHGLVSVLSNTRTCIKDTDGYIGTAMLLLRGRWNYHNPRLSRRGYCAMFTRLRIAVVFNILR